MRKRGQVRREPLDDLAERINQCDLVLELALFGIVASRVKPVRHASSPPTMPALADSRSQRAGLMRASSPRKARYGMRAVVRNSATCARSRSASSKSSSNPSARAAGSSRDAIQKNAGIPARSKAEARWAVYAAGSCSSTAIS